MSNGKQKLYYILRMEARLSIIKYQILIRDKTDEKVF